MPRKRKGLSLRKEHKSEKGGLTEKGRKYYNQKTGSNLKRPQPKGGPRKRSFCARMSGVKGPMKDAKGRPTRKALALRRWKC
ncbi:MAG: hypothetical protein CMK66_01430 [Pseudoalteromonas sp.]|nr:hypothetical protein [Pseudoalteromonas sp.]